MATRSKVSGYVFSEVHSSSEKQQQSTHQKHHDPETTPKKHPDLRCTYGDPVFRRSVWAPFFENILEGKVIYREKFICLARIDDLEIDEYGVRGIVVPLQFLFQYPHLITPSRPWRFGGF